MFLCIFSQKEDLLASTTIKVVKGMMGDWDNLSCQPMEGFQIYEDQSAIPTPTGPSVVYEQTYRKFRTKDELAVIERLMDQNPESICASELNGRTWMKKWCMPTLVKLTNTTT